MPPSIIRTPPLCRNGAKVTVFEKEDACGGHALTDESTKYPVDLGFQVFNLTTYPNLVGMFEELGVESEPSSMSFALSMDGGEHEWSSEALFGQKSNLASPAFLRMLWDVLRFGREAPQVLDAKHAHAYEGVTLGQYLDRKGYSEVFRTHYVLPMCAAVWSVPNATVLEFPVKMLVRFWINHHLLDVFDRPLWRVVKGRSSQYVAAITKALGEMGGQVRTSCAAKAVRREAKQGSDGSLPRGLTRGGVKVTLSDGKTESFDGVILATHSDTSLSLLGDHATAAERAALGSIPYNANDVWLHTDASLMPKRKECWTSWNFLGSSGDSADSAVCVTYWLNLLQNLPAEAPDMFVTLNPIHEPRPETVLRRLSLDHPVFSEASVAAQEALPSLQGAGGVYFCGAWGAYGFHEDGLKASLAVTVDAMGCRVPWNQIATSPKIKWFDRQVFGLVDNFLQGMIKKGQLRLVLPDGTERVYGPGLKSTDYPEPEDEWWGRPLPDCTVRVINMAFAWKIMTRHDTGMGEAWMDGDIVCKDPGAFMAVIVANAKESEEARGSLGLLNYLGDKLLYYAHLARHNNEENSRKNIEEHYDAGNEMYKAFLDETMTYSCAIHAPGRTLYDSQIAKIDALVKGAGIQKGDKVLEIGCGWGAFAIRAVQTTGCRVIGLTLSKEQLAEANVRIKEAGLEDSIDLLYCDYRNCPGEGTFDRVVSCEMIEAVGHEYLESYFQTIGRMLKPGGQACIQSITCPDERYEAYCNSSDFIREHIFPGGHLPSVGACVEALRGTGLALAGTHDIGPHYAVTLRAWRKQWEEKRDHIIKIGYSERFWRKYQFYFAYCEAAFDLRYIHDYHLTFKKSDRLVAHPGATSNKHGGGPAKPVDHTMASGDLFTQSLAACWWFLAGIACSRVPMLSFIPATSVALVCFLLAALGVQRMVSPASAKLMTIDQRISASQDVLQLAYSSAMTLGAALFIRANPAAATDLLYSPTDAQATHALVMVCVAAGWMSFRLWLEVQGPVQLSSLPTILMRTVLLSIFTVSAYTERHTATLAATLVLEGPRALSAMARLVKRPVGGSSSGRGGAQRSFRVLETVALVLVNGAVLSALGKALYYQAGSVHPALPKVAVVTTGCAGLFSAVRFTSWVKELRSPDL